MRNVCFHNISFLFCSTEKAKEREWKKPTKIHPIFSKNLDHLKERAVVKVDSGRTRVGSSLRVPLCAVGVKHWVLQEQQQACIPAHSKGIHSPKSAWIVLLSTGSTALCFSIAFPGTGWAEPKSMSGSVVVFSVWAGNAFSAGQLRHVY